MTNGVSQDTLELVVTKMLYSVHTDGTTSRRIAYRIHISNKHPLIDPSCRLACLKDLKGQDNGSVPSWKHAIPVRSAPPPAIIFVASVIEHVRHLE